MVHAFLQVQKLAEVKSRVYENEDLRLLQAGFSKKDAVRGLLHVRVYFTPDLPSTIHVAAKTDGPVMLSDGFVERDETWRNQIPRRLLASGKYLSAAVDETNTKRFLCTYLCKSPPPRDVQELNLLIGATLLSGFALPGGAACSLCLLYLHYLLYAPCLLCLLYLLHLLYVRCLLYLLYLFSCLC